MPPHCFNAFSLRKFAFSWCVDFVVARFFFMLLAGRQAAGGTNSRYRWSPSLNGAVAVRFWTMNNSEKPLLLTRLVLYVLVAVPGASLHGGAVPGVNYALTGGLCSDCLRSAILPVLVVCLTSRC